MSLVNRVSYQYFDEDNGAVSQTSLKIFGIPLFTDMACTQNLQVVSQFCELEDMSNSSKLYKDTKIGLKPNGENDNIEENA